MSDTTKWIDTLIIGAGQAGLAMSRSLMDCGVDHVLLERGRVAERWRSERWESLRLLTPNWQSRLPGWRYRGNDPDGYMTMPELIAYLEGYARSFAAPVQTATTVLSVAPATDGDGYVVRTSRETWRAANVVIATGHADVPHVPGMAQRLSNNLLQLVPTHYRNASSLPEGGVLVVGASASGIQLADEIARAGRRTALAVGRHIRLPRLYRGRDILWWLDAMGTLDERPEQVWNAEASRHQPSLQLVGRPDHASLDLRTLQDQGVELLGRVAGIELRKAFFADDLAASTARADAKLRQLLARIDSFAAQSGLAAEIAEPEPMTPVRPGASPSMLDLRRAGISTVVWATGFRRAYSWLQVPVLDRRGEIVHEGGVTAAPGLYVLGLYFQRRRKSSFIDGVGHDAAEIAVHIAERSAGAWSSRRAS